MLLLLLLLLVVLKAQDYASSTRNTIISLRILSSDVKNSLCHISSYILVFLKQKFLYLAHYK